MLVVTPDVFRPILASLLIIYLWQLDCAQSLLIVGVVHKLANPLSIEHLRVNRTLEETAISHFTLQLLITISALISHFSEIIL
jgi:hypothetical protein